MNTVIGWLIAWGLAMSIVALYFALLSVNKHRAKESLAASKQKTIDTRTQERNEARKQRDELNRENGNLYESISEQAKTNTRLLDENYKLREDLQEKIAERDKWMHLYGELVNTLHDLQGDAHATAPLVEAAPMAYSEAKPAIEQAAATSKPGRTKRGKITGGAQ